MINRSFKEFKRIHKKKLNQVIYSSLNIKNESFLINLINNFLCKKNSFVFESVEKGKIRGRYTIFGKDPDKIWEFNNNHAYSINSFNKKGEQLLILNNPVLRNPEFFENPNKYIPERWTTEMEKSYYSISFNQGPQRCPAKELAIFLVQSFMVNFIKMSDILTRGSDIFKTKKINTDNIDQMINTCNLEFKLK